MPEEVKFTEEELKQVQEIQNEYSSIQNTFGQLKMAKLRLEEQMDNLNKNEHDNLKKLSEISDKEKKFLDEITKKYGQGTLNPETGVFSPTENKS